MGRGVVVVAGIVAAGLVALSVALHRAGQGPLPAGPAAELPPGGVADNWPVFEERARETGLLFVHDAGARGSYYFPEIMGAGVGLLDYDGDGDLDVYFVQGGPIGPEAALDPGQVNRLFRNELAETGTLRFTDVTEQSGVGDDGYGMGCATGDYDNDGHVDLFVTNFGESRLYRNRGDGTFEDVTAAAGLRVRGWATSAAFVDFDHDGNIDLFVAFYVEYSVASNWPCKTATGEPDYCGPMNYPGAQPRLYRNGGGGKFVEVTAAAGMEGAKRHGLGVACADLTGDGRVDIFVANDGDGNQLWVNQGGGRFRDEGLMSGSAMNDAGQAEAGMGVGIGDYDEDGDDDIFITHLTGEKNTLYAMIGPGLFEDVSVRAGLSAPSLPMTGFGTEWFDYDNDGRLDLFATNGAVTRRPEQRGSDWPFRQCDQLFRNRGDGRFEDVSARAGAAFGVAAVGRGAAFGDIDNDGDIDIVATYCNEPARLLLNRVGNRRPWTRVRLVGTENNWDGIGAVVTLVGRDGRRVHRHAHRDGSYLSANDVRVHFGLGGMADVERVEVLWPSGRREAWPFAGMRREVVLTEGTGRDASG